MTARTNQRPFTGRRLVYRALLACCPRTFRSMYGRQMEEDFGDLLAAQTTWRGRIAAWGIGLRDLISVAWSERRRPRRAHQAAHPGRHQRSPLISTFAQDIRIAARAARRSPGFTALVTLTLALGIGGTVAMFSVADAVLLADLPYRDSDRLAMIWNHSETNGSAKILISGPDYLDYRSQTTAFEDFAFIHNATDSTLTDGDRAEQVDVGYISANLFTFLGAAPIAGRLFSADDAEMAGTQMAQVGPVVISHALWTRRYGADPAAIGRTIFLSGQPVQIVGVLPADFRLVLPVAQGGAMSAGANDVINVWRILPERSFASIPRSVALIRLIGRLAPGVSLQQAQQEFDAFAATLRRTYPLHDQRGTAIDIVPLRTEVVGHVRTILLSLFGGVGVVLLIACANVANLVSVEEQRRAHDVAVRLALGAGRARILRQAFTNYAVLAGAGTLAGVCLAWGFIRTIVALAPPNVPFVDQVGLDLRAVGFAALVGTATTLLFGTWPALRAATLSPAGGLASGARSVVGHGHQARRILVAAEIALSVVLLVSGGLLIRSFVRLQQASLGFEPAAVVTGRISLATQTYDDGTRRQFWDDLQRALDAHPAIARAGLVSPLPFRGLGAEVPFDSVGGDLEGWGRYLAFVFSARPGYFEAMGAELLEGRLFDARDLDRAGNVAVIDDIAARQLYPDGPAVGRSVYLDRRPVEIIGVVRHIRHSQVTGDERAAIFRPAANTRNLALVIKPVIGAGAITAIVRDIVTGLDANVPVFDERPLSGYVDDQIAPTRFTMTLASAFGVMALVMAVVGLYGAVSYGVSQRSKELGLRLALGAGAGSVVRLVVRQGAVVAVIGLAIGLAGAVAVTRAIGSLLIGVPPTDPAVYVLAAAIIGIAALAASYVPARRAGRLDPVTTLRSE